MNIYRQELRAFTRSTIGWTTSLVGTLVISLVIYPSFAQDTALLLRIIKGFGDQAGRALGLDMLQILGVTGYYGFLLIYLAVIGGIQAMLLGAGLVTRERRNKTADFLFAKPVTRLRIYGEKLLAVFVLLLITNAVFLGTALAMVRAVAGSESVEMRRILLISLNVLWIQLFFLAVGFCAAVCLPRLKSAFTLSMSTVFGLFIVHMIALVLQDPVLRCLTPFQYFDAAQVLLYGEYDLTQCLVGGGVTLAALVAGLAVADRRDLPAL